MRLGCVGRSNLAVIAVGYAGGLVAFPSLPGPYLGAESLAARLALAFLLPTAALVTCASVEMIFNRPISSARHLESAKAIRVVITTTAVFVIALHGLVLVSLLGLQTSAIPVHRLALMLFGLTLIWIGNVLPRVRPNGAIGVRTRRLVDDAVAWSRVHRTVGYSVVILGAVIVAAGLMLSKSQIPLVLSWAVAFGATMNLAAYRRWTGR